jgi:hypothetical protein
MNDTSPWPAEVSATELSNSFLGNLLEEWFPWPPPAGQQPPLRIQEGAS